MKQAYIAAAAALAIGGLGATPAMAACNAGNSTQCAAGIPHAAQRPLQLHPSKSTSSHHHHVASRSAHRRSRHSSSHRVVAKSHHERAKPAETKTAHAEAPNSSAPADTGLIQPKQVPTMAIATPPIAVAPSQQATGFAASHEPWSQVSAFAPTDEQTNRFPPNTSDKNLPDDMSIVPNNQVNDIDRAADAAKVAAVNPAQGDDAKSGTQASSQTAKAAAITKPETTANAKSGHESWTGWLYRKCASGLSTAASAIRAVLM